MMSLKKLCSTLILTLVLATSVLAGTMEGGEIAPPKAPAPATAQGGGMECPAVQPTPDAATGVVTSAADVSVTEAALGLVGTVLALF